MDIREAIIQQQIRNLTETLADLWTSVNYYEENDPAKAVMFKDEAYVYLEMIETLKGLV